MAVGSSRQWKPSRGVSHNSSKRNAFDSSDRGTASGAADSNDRADARDRNSLREPIDSTYFAGSGSLKAKGSPPGFPSDARFTRLLRSSHEDSSSMRESKGSFVPYLPQDDAVAAGLGADEGGIDAVETQEVADLLNEELGKLLKMKPREFWRTVAMDNTIQASLDSYLQFRRRWYDSPMNEGGRWLAGIIVGDQELFRRVFMVLYRMSLSLEPGSSASDDLSPEQHAEIIQEKRLFDVPKILDICAIYGRDNPDLTQCLVNNIFVDQKYNSDLAEVVPILLKTIYTMHQRCSSTLMMLPSTSTSQISVALKLEQELLEVLDFLNDAVVTLQSFIAAYPQGSIILVSIGSQSILREQLLPSLAAVHDALLPTVRKTFSRLGSSGVTSSVESATESRWKRLRVGLMELSWQLLSLSYLSDKSVVDQHNYIFMTDPGARGQAFVQVASSMAADLSEGFGYQLSGSVKEELISVGALLRNIEKKHKLLERVEKLRDEGFIALDDIQYEYFGSLVNHASSLPSQLPKFSHLSLTDQNGGQRQEADILYESKISHIKDILPDYGNGFIAACLEAYDFNPEEVIQRILDETLHPSLLSLDKTLESKPGGLVTTVNTNDKGKGKVDEAPSLALHKKGGKNGIVRKDKNDVTSSASIVSNVEADGLVQRLASSRSASSSSAVEFNRELPSKISVLDSVKNLKGRFVRKEKGEGNAALVLDERDEEDALRTAAYAAQYEDEYDDSFDDLGTNITDGVEETESLVDLFAFRSSGAGSSGQTSKIFTKAKSGGLPKSTWAEDDSGGLRVNRPMALNPAMERTSFARENGNRSSDTDRRPPFHPTRGRGRGRREEPKAQYFVKDGKNYSYKVPGSVAVSSKEEAEFLNKTEEETIYGLGRGGNVPVVVQEATDGNASTEPHVHRGSRAVHTDLSGHGREHSHGRGGPRKGHDDHHRKDRAMKKHFASVGGM